MKETYNEELLSIEGFIEFVNKQDPTTAIQNNYNGTPSYRHCAIGTYVKETLNVLDESWGAYFSLIFLQTCYTFNNQVISDYNYQLCKDLGNCKFDTYGELQEYLLTIN